MSTSDLGPRRERLRRAVEDGDRLYRKRLDKEATQADNNRIDGILSLDLADALALVDTALELREEAERERDEERERLRRHVETMIEPEILRRAEVAEDRASLFEQKQQQIVALWARTGDELKEIVATTKEEEL